MLISPEDNGVDIDPMTLLEAGYAAGGHGSLHRATRWQISRDETFESLVLDITSVEHLLGVTVPHRVLDGQTVYYWRARFTGTDGLVRMWSAVNRFTTEDASYADDNRNHVPDDQELQAGTEPAIHPLQEEGWRPEVYYLDILADDGTPVQVAMKVDTDVTAMDFFGHAPSTQLVSAQACPDDLAMGLFSIRLHTATSGPARVRLYFSRPLAENAIWYKHDTISGWQDYSGFATFSDDRTTVTIELVDGGFGDADGVANGIIVDPSGPAVQTTDSGGETTGGGGCFIHSLFPDP
jgi:hypothetical protein